MLFRQGRITPNDSIWNWDGCDSVLDPAGGSVPSPPGKVNTMEYGKLLGDAWGYMRQGVLGNGSRWAKLMLGTILISLPLMGYLMRVYRGADPAPEMDEWGTLTIDGLKLLVVGIIYSIPIFILEIISSGPEIAAAFRGEIVPTTEGSFSQNPFLIALIFIFDILIAIFVPIAMIRFARMNKFCEAFNFGAILETIGKIGWLRYILAIIIVAIVVGIPVMVLFMAIVVLGILSGSFLATLAAVLIVLIIIAPVVEVFQARYMTRVYDSAAGEPVAEAAAPTV